MKKTWFLIMVLLVQLIVTLGLGTAVTYANVHDRAPSGLDVWGQDFSGLSKSEVSNHLKGMIPNTVSYKGRVYPLSTDRSNTEIDTWVNQVFPVSSGSWFLDTIHILGRRDDAISLSNLGLNKEEIIPQLEELSRHIDQPTRLSTIAYSEGRLVRTLGQSGEKLDIESTWLKLSLEHRSRQVEAVVAEVPSEPSNSDIMKIQSILGDYTTYFNAQDLPRTKNVRLAALALNNRLIPPGQVFSFNDVVGERTEAAGYLPAYVFVDRAVVKGDGGGICQDSSTLYQVVRQANLPIEEKHTHSLPVSYVLKGEDATVSYGILDFRFRNDTQGYLLMSASTGSNWLRIRLLGVADDKHPVLKSPDGYPTHPMNWN
ncbi:MAG: VanW family protein [Bacillota bacterium]|nr:VanW family protein [Bacillota bacterium]MDP4158409.1 VanW family protein [Bacillota bacterium]